MEKMYKFELKIFDEFIFQKSLISFQILVLLIGLSVGIAVENEFENSEKRDTDFICKRFRIFMFYS